MNSNASSEGNNLWIHNRKEFFQSNLYKISNTIKKSYVAEYYIFCCILGRNGIHFNSRRISGAKIMN